MTSNIRPWPNSQYREIYNIIQGFVLDLGLNIRTNVPWFADTGMIFKGELNSLGDPSVDIYFKFEIYAPTETRKTIVDNQLEWATVSEWSIAIRNSDVSAYNPAAILTLADPEFFQKFEQYLNQLHE